MDPPPRPFLPGVITINSSRSAHRRGAPHPRVPRGRSREMTSFPLGGGELSGMEEGSRAAADAARRADEDTKVIAQLGDDSRYAFRIVAVERGEVALHELAQVLRPS